jgi:hypothetical protein
MVSGAFAIGWPALTLLRVVADDSVGSNVLICTLLMVGGLRIAFSMAPLVIHEVMFRMIRIVRRKLDHVKIILSIYDTVCLRTLSRANEAGIPSQHERSAFIAIRVS